MLYYVVCVFRSPVSGFKLAPFGLPLSLFLTLAPPPPFRPAFTPSPGRPLCCTSAGDGILCSPGCSLALSHPQCAHRTRPGRKSFPLRRADHVSSRLAYSTCTTAGRRVYFYPRGSEIRLWARRLPPWDGSSIASVDLRVVSRVVDAPGSTGFVEKLERVHRFIWRDGCEKKGVDCGWFE